MGEKVDSRFRDPIQGRWNRNSIRYSGNYGKATFLSSSFNDNGVGRSVSPMGALHHGNEFPRGDESSKQEKISIQNAYQLGRQNSDDGGECVGSSSNIEFNDFGGKKEDCTIHVRSVNPQWNSNTGIGERDIFQQQVNSGVKSESYTSIIECCPNQKRTQTLQTSMGQLLRIGTLAGTTWTKEISKTPCHLVVPNVQPRGAKIPESVSPVPAGGKQDEVRGRCNGSTNPLMIVEMIASESDRCRVATSINCNLENEDPSICYMRDIKRFGFDHIIIIGERYCGLLFLDCFGRVFDWDSMSGVLWPLGDYWNLTTKKSRTSCIVWGLEFDGTIVEFEDDSPNEYYTYPVAEKDKRKSLKKKKRSSKKKHR